MSALRRFPIIFFAGITVALATAMAAAAQPAPKDAQKDQPGGAMQGLQLNRDQPVKIESDALEVRDKSQQATFIGKVKLTQGDTVLQCQNLVIFYEDGSAAPAQKKGGKTAQKGGAAGGGQQIKRAEAKGDLGVFDVKSNTVTLTGNVVVTQGTNVLRGDRMVVDLTTGVSRVESNQTQRVEGLFSPSSTPQPPPQQPPPPAPAAQKDAKGAKPAPAKPAPGGPIRIN